MFAESEIERASATLISEVEGRDFCSYRVWRADQTTTRVGQAAVDPMREIALPARNQQVASGDEPLKGIRRIRAAPDRLARR
jgi:hypothetical protein